MAPKPPLKHLVRLARHLEDSLAPAACSWTPPIDRLNKLLALGWRLQFVERRGWRLAAQECAARIEIQAQFLESDLRHSLRHQDRPDPDELPPARLPEILKDLLALQEEFQDLRVDFKSKSLSVVTEDIVLEGVDLGAFRIVLDWGRPYRSPPFDVIPQQARYASSNPSVCHPHVLGETLCVGDGKVPLRQALAQGRFYDFFVIVRQVLETYNRSSAYVPLSDWTGESCPDCGDLRDEGSLSLCELCQNELCGNCLSLCEFCERYHCSECRDTCQGCDRGLCTGCIRSCDECADEFCERCLTNGTCAECLESLEETPADESLPLPSTSAAPPAPALGARCSAADVQPVCLGQTPVPA